MALSLIRKDNGNTQSNFLLSFHSSDGELYTGTMNNFQGNEPIITRTLGNRVVLKSDFFFTWLNGKDTEGAGALREKGSPCVAPD